MAKKLAEILKGTKKSRVDAGSVGGLTPTSGGDKEFVAKHKTEKHEDRVGNTDDVYKGKTKKAKYPTAPQNESITLDVETLTEESLDAFVEQIVLGRLDEETQLDEISPNLAARYVQKSTKTLQKVDAKKIPNRIEGAKRALDRYDEKHYEKKKLGEEEVLDEGLRLIKTHTSGPHSAKVYKDNEWDEHRVKFYKNGVYQKNADHHTDDIEDAHNTAQYQLKKWSNTKDVKEETQLDEISKTTLKNYILKNSKQAQESPAKTAREINNRVGGMTLAHLKIDGGEYKPYRKRKYRKVVPATEETQLDELSKSTVANYAIKAGSDIASREASNKKLSLHMRKAQMDKDAADLDKNSDMKKAINAAMDKMGSSYAKNIKKTYNRRVGTQRALSRLKEETEQLDELSKEVLKNYVDRADYDKFKTYNDAAAYHTASKLVANASKSDKETASKLYGKGNELVDKAKKRDNKIQLAKKKLNEEASCDDEKGEMKILKKLDKNTKKLIKKDAEVHKKLGEETVLNEISKKLVNNYLEKASTSTRDPNMSKKKRDERWYYKGLALDKYQAGSGKYVTRKVVPATGDEVKGDKTK